MRLGISRQEAAERSNAVYRAYTGGLYSMADAWERDLDLIF